MTTDRVVLVAHALLRAASTLVSTLTESQSAALSATAMPVPSGEGVHR